MVLGELGASATASDLMSFGPWMPILLRTSSTALSFCVSLFLPETLALRGKS